MHLWTESRWANNHFFVFIWINYIDLSLFFSLHQAYSRSIQCKNETKLKTENKQNRKTIQRQSCAAQRIPSFTLLLDNILYIYIYTVCVYFCHSYKNKIRYCRCPTIHTRWKQNTEKLYSPHWGQRYTRLLNKSEREKEGRNSFVFKK